MKRAPALSPTAPALPPGATAALAVLALAAAYTVVVRARLAGLPLERDEGEYAYFGQLLLQGIPPYGAAYSMKLPGTYAMYALVMAIGGQTAAAIRLGLLVVNGAAASLVYLVGRRVVDATAGAVAAAAFLLTSASVCVLGFAAHATQFVVPFALGGLFLLDRADERGGARDLAASGALFGMSVLMKQHAAAFVLFGALWLVRLPGPRLRRAGIFLAGAAAPLVLTVALLVAAGVGPKFWFWNVVYASQYARGSTLEQGLDNIAYVLRQMVPLAGFALLAAAGGIGAAWDARARRGAAFFGSFFVFGLLAVSPGLYFRDHYFILVLPAVALLSGLAVALAVRRLGRAAALGAVVLATGWLLMHDYGAQCRWPYGTFCRRVFGTNPFPEAVGVAAYLRDHTSPGERIAVLGSEPEIFFYARRRDVTGHVYMYGLMENQPYARTMQHELMADVEAAAPRYVVLVNVPMSWLGHDDSVTDVIDWGRVYIGTHYEQVGLVPVTDPPSAGVWDAAAAERAPGNGESISVYRRK